MPLVLHHPLTTVAKSARSAWDNLWILFGPNLSTFPGLVPFFVLAIALFASVRGTLRQVPWAVWVACAAVLAETVLPPLTLGAAASAIPLAAGAADRGAGGAHSGDDGGAPRGQLIALAFFVATSG